MLVDRELTKLSPDFPNIDIERVDIMAHPRQTWNDGIRMIPALKNGDRILSGILLAKKDIQRFMEEAV